MMYEGLLLHGESKIYLFNKIKAEEEIWKILFNALILTLKI